MLQWGALLGSAATSHAALKTACEALSKLQAIPALAQTAQAQPPQHVLDELLRLCALHGDMDSVFHVMQHLEKRGQKVDFERLNAAFTYFPRSME